jgi:hypothetical protein
MLSPVVSLLSEEFSKMSRILTCFVAIWTIGLLSIDRCDGGIRSWDAGGDGSSWEDNCNWSGNEGFPGCTGFQPFDGDDAVISFGNPVVRFLEGVASVTVAQGARIDLDGVLNAHNGVMNQAVIDIGVAGGQLNIGVFNPSNTLLQGGGEVILANSSNNPARVQGAQFVSSFVTHETGHTIRGEGLVNGKWINNGLIRAEETSGDTSARLVISGTMTNHGVIRSSPTGTVLLESATLTMGATGQLIADTQSVELSVASIIGGSISAINGAKFVRNPNAGGSTVFSGVTINGDFDVLVNNASVTGTGTGITNNGTLTLDNLNVANGELFMASGSTLDGTGQVILNRANDNTHLSGSFTHGASHTIRGVGRFHATVVNNGSILAEPKNSGSLLRVVGNAITNNHLMQANDGATLRLEQQVAITQSAGGRINAADGGRVELRDFATIHGGKLQTAGTGVIVDVSASVLNNVTNEGNFHVQAGSTTRVNTTLVNHGTITVNPTGVAGITTLEFSSDTVLSGTGTIVLNQTGNGAKITSAGSSQDITQTAGHTIRGAGWIANGFFGDGRFINHGRLEGNSASEPLVITARLSGRGVLKNVNIAGFQVSHTLGEVGTTAIVPVEGLYDFDNGSSMLLDLAGTTPGTGHDQLNSTGPITLDNAATRLEAKISSGFVPAAGDMFKVITTTDTLTGTFGSVILPSLIPHFSLTWKPVQYTARDVILEILSVTPFVADADFNNDGLYNCVDVDALVGDIATGNNGPLFDLTADGVVDTDDLTRWLADAGAENLASGNPYLPGDATLDGVVDGSDFGVWNSNKFTSVPRWCAGDFNADGSVDGSDFGIWNSRKFTSSDGSSLVPEPTTGFHVCWILWLAVGRRSRAN